MSVSNSQNSEANKELSLYLLNETLYLNPTSCGRGFNKQPSFEEMGRIFKEILAGLDEFFYLSFKEDLKHFELENGVFEDSKFANPPGCFPKSKTEIPESSNQKSFEKEKQVLNLYNVWKSFKQFAMKKDINIEPDGWPLNDIVVNESCEFYIAPLKDIIINTFRGLNRREFYKIEMDLKKKFPQFYKDLLEEANQFALDKEKAHESSEHRMFDELDKQNKRLIEGIEQDEKQFEALTLSNEQFKILIERQIEEESSLRKIHKDKMVFLEQQIEACKKIQEVFSNLPPTNECEMMSFNK